MRDLSMSKKWKGEDKQIWNMKDRLRKIGLGGNHRNNNGNSSRRTLEGKMKRRKEGDKMKRLSNRE